MAGQRMTWAELSRSDRYRGRWVALDQCRYDKAGGNPSEGEVVDADVDLQTLCNRVKKAERPYCAIVFCGEGS